ncbi:MAG: hypothetical protein GTN64_07475 [Candidatus Latescibacteria bacterium]|nr:hypothetical protein [Candidatus Latescibacterota bacterium]NIO78443.1 hypothetical protein [Candidatus Latescibacterota bacterium]
MKDDLKKQLLTWIKATVQESQKGFDEAEKDREKSDYTDIDALEQSVACDFTIKALTDVKAFIESAKARKEMLKEIE